ncbi:hypothetical protein DMN91_007163, partial [Ooceraea biroi]
KLLFTRDATHTKSLAPAKSLANIKCFTYLAVLVFYPCNAGHRLIHSNAERVFARNPITKVLTSILRDPAELSKITPRIFVPSEIAPSLPLAAITKHPVLGNIDRRNRSYPPLCTRAADTYNGSDPSTTTTQSAG